MRRAAIALLLASCGGETFKPVTVIDGLRVLAVRAEPAEVGPGESTRLTALVADPLGGGRALRKIWLACDPEPGSPFGNRCAQFTSIREPAQLLASADAVSEAARLVRVIGLEEAVYQAPAGIFDALPPDHLARKRGLTAVVILMVAPKQSEDLAADLRAAAEDKVENELVIKRLKVRAGPERNENPILLDVATEDGASGEALSAPRSGEAKLRPIVNDGAAEHYLEIDADGRAAEKDEQPVFYWFTTSGRWEHGKTLGPELAVFAPPQKGDDPPPPESGIVPLWVVVRDARGGASWLTREIALR